MAFSYSALLAAIMLLPLIACAQPATPSADPADEQAIVPETAYQSAFAHYRHREDDGKVPDRVWVRADDPMRPASDAGHRMHDMQPHAAPAATGKSAPHDHSSAEKQE